MTRANGPRCAIYCVVWSLTPDGARLSNRRNMRSSCRLVVLAMDRSCPDGVNLCRTDAATIKTDMLRQR